MLRFLCCFMGLFGESFATMGMTLNNTTTTIDTMATDNQASTPNMEWLLSAPLLEAALAQIKSLDQFQALMDSFSVAEKNGQVIPGHIKAKLGGKQKQLHETLVKTSADKYFEESGLLPLLVARNKWEDVHFMAEAHGVGSSIPMVTYTGLSQEEMETGMNAFYKHLQSAKLDLGGDQALQKEVANIIMASYKDLHETATGEFGGYMPFQTMVEHTPAKVEELVQKQCQAAEKTDTAMDYLTSQAQFP